MCGVRVCGCVCVNVSLCVLCVFARLTLSLCVRVCLFVDWWFVVFVCMRDCERVCLRVCGVVDLCLCVFV